MKSEIISEKMLRQMWREQSFSKLPLLTNGGKEIKVVSPGKSNPDGGPDFLDAQIYIGGTLYTGDVELHRNIDDWKQHTHEADAKYNRLILHVVFYNKVSNNFSIKTRSKRVVPTVFLESYISREQMQNEPVDVLSLRRLKCADINTSISSDIIRNWLQKLSVERSEYKVRRIEERLKELIRFEKLKEPPARYGEIPVEVSPEEMPNFEPEYSANDFTNVHHWEQVLYEYTMEALGYSKNQVAFLKLARLLPLNKLKLIHQSRESEERIFAFEALLFRYSGLLPSVKKVEDKESRAFVAKLKYTLTNVNINSTAMNEAEWQFFRLRPENFPTIRIAGASRIIDRIISSGLFKSIIKITSDEDLSNDGKLKHIVALLKVDADSFWQNHFTLDKKSEQQIKVLIGKERVIEIIINVVIPILLLYARIFKKREIRQNALHIFEAIKSSKTSSLIRTLNSELIRDRFEIDTAPLYQGAVQLYKFYCAEEKCAGCEIGKQTGIS